MENNQAFVAYLENIQPIAGADKIVQADVVLIGIKITQVVVEVDTEPHTKIVYFDSNLCLSQRVLEDYPELNTYLAKNGRIRVIKLKGVISNGLAIEVSKFLKYCPKDPSTIPYQYLEEGRSFTSLGDTEICHRYQPPIKNQPQQGKKGKKEKIGTPIVTGHFPENIDTAQLLRNLHVLNPNDCIQLTTKFHGTSSRAGNVLVKRNLTLIEKILFKLNVSIKDTEYKYVYGSRRVTKYIENTQLKVKKNHFYSYDLYTDAGEKYFKNKLHKGEIIYFEICGWTPEGKPIQKIGKAVYNYGANVNTYNIWVYRITYSDEDGNIYEYSTRALRERCKELGVNPVTELYYGLAKDLYPQLNIGEEWTKNFLDNLKKDYLEKIRTDCIYPKTYDEGICLRIESSGIQVFKLKSEHFLNSESEASTDEKIEDIEEQN